MSGTPGKDATFLVKFDPTTLAEDAEHCTPKARAILRDTVHELNRDDISAGRLKGCEDSGRDGTRLSGCAKVYLPPPAGEWGMVFQLRLDDQVRPFLACLAFGIRHPRRSWQPSVYEVADRSEPYKPPSPCWELKTGQLVCGEVAQPRRWSYPEGLPRPLDPGARIVTRLHIKL